MFKISIIYYICIGIKKKYYLIKRRQILMSQNEIDKMINYILQITPNKKKDIKESIGVNRKNMFMIE